MRVFAATTIILPVLESTTHETSRRMLHSTQMKVVKQTTSTLFLSLFLKKGDNLIFFVPRYCRDDYNVKYPGILFRIMRMRTKK